MLSKPSPLAGHLHSSLPLSPSRSAPCSLLLSYPFLVTLSPSPLTLSFYDLALSTQHHYTIRESFLEDPLVQAEILSSSGDYVMVLLTCVQGSKCIRVPRNRSEEELVLSTGKEHMLPATSSFEIEGSLLLFSPSGQLYEIMIDDLFCSSENFLTIGENEKISQMTTKSFPLPESDLSIFVIISKSSSFDFPPSTATTENPPDSFYFARYIKDSIFFDRKLLCKPLSIFIYPYPVYEHDLCIITQPNGIIKLFSVDATKETFLLVQSFNCFGSNLLFSGFDTCHEFFILHSQDEENNGMIEFYNVNRLILGEKSESLAKAKTVDFFDHLLPFEMGKEAKNQRFFGLVTTLDSVDQCFFHVFDKDKAKIDLYALSIPFIHQKQSKISEEFANNLASIKETTASFASEILNGNFGALFGLEESAELIKIDEKALEGILIEKKIEKGYRETMENIMFLKMKQLVLDQMAPELEKEMKKSFEEMVKRFQEKMTRTLESIKTNSERLGLVSTKLNYSIFGLVNVCSYMSQLTKANVGLLEWMATKEGSHKAQEIKGMVENNTRLIEMLARQLNNI